MLIKEIFIKIFECNLLLGLEVGIRNKIGLLDSPFWMNWLFKYDQKY